MKKIAIAAVMTAGLTLAGCEANVKEEGEMPSMDVDVSGDAGELPEIDVETADVECSRRRRHDAFGKVIFPIIDENGQARVLAIFLPWPCPDDSGCGHG